MVGQGSSPRGLLVAIVPVFVGLAFVLRPCGSRAVPNIDVEAVLRQGYRLTTRSWEYGALTEALLELYNPELTVFAETPFPKNEIPKPLLDYIPALQYVKSFISTDAESLINGEGSPADPASLGIPAMLIGQSFPEYRKAAVRQADYLVNKAMRFKINDTKFAISHRDDPPEAWGDFVYMVPPFLAYHAVATGNSSYMTEAVQQCRLYNEILRTLITLPDGSQCHGLWHHIVTQPPSIDPSVCCTDPDVWLTSNSWALAGMTRVLVTVMTWKSPYSNVVARLSYDAFRKVAIDNLRQLIGGMLQCLMAQSRDPNTGLLRNYLDLGAGHTMDWQYGDAAGTAMVTAATYRLMVLDPDLLTTDKYLAWAEENYRVVAKHVKSDGLLSPVARVDEVPARSPAEHTGEGQSMLIMMYAARRDCVESGRCSKTVLHTFQRILDNLRSTMF